MLLILLIENSIGYGISCDIYLQKNNSTYYGENMFICVYLYNSDKDDESSKKYYFFILIGSFNTTNCRYIYYGRVKCSR